LSLLFETNFPASIFLNLGVVLKKRTWTPVELKRNSDS